MQAWLSRAPTVLNPGRGRSDGDLRKLGISEAALAKERQGQGGKSGSGGGGEGIFEAEKLRALLMGLVCSADPIQPAPSERAGKALFDDFEYLEGYPHVRLPMPKPMRGKEGGKGRVNAVVDVSANWHVREICILDKSLVHDLTPRLPVHTF